MTQELAIPVSFEETTNLARAFVQSGMFSDTKQLSQAIVKIQAGRELGLPPVYSMQNINMIRNRLTTSANTMAMLIKKSGRYNYRIKEHTDRSCTIVFYELDGEKWIEVGESTFTLEDAKRADLVKPDSGWMKYPRAMLFSRAISQGARLYCPDAIGGIYTDEEIRSIPPQLEEAPIDITIGVTPDAPKSTTEAFIKAVNGKGRPAPEIATEIATETDIPDNKFWHICKVLGYRSRREIFNALKMEIQSLDALNVPRDSALGYLANLQGVKDWRNLLEKGV